MKKGLVMGTHPRRGEDVGSELLAGDGAGGCMFDCNGGFRRGSAPAFGDLAEKLGIEPKFLGQLREPTGVSCVACNVHG